MRNHRWSRTTVFLLLAGLAGVSYAGTITLDTSKIPPSPGTLKRLKNSRANPPTAFVQEALANSHPNAKVENLGQSDFAKRHGITAAKNVQAAIDRLTRRPQQSRSIARQRLKLSALSRYWIRAS